MKYLTRGIAPTILFALIVFFSCDQMTVDEIEELDPSVTLACGNMLPQFALVSMKPHFNDRRTVTYAFEDYEPSLKWQYEDSLFQELLLSWLDTTGRDIKRTDPSCADIVIRHRKQTDGALAYVSEIGSSGRFNITISTMFDYLHEFDPNYIDLEIVLDHEIGHALGLFHYAGCNCVMEPNYRNIPRSGKTRQDVGLLLQIGYCKLEINRICTLIK